LLSIQLITWYSKQLHSFHTQLAITILIIVIIRLLQKKLIMWIVTFRNLARSTGGSAWKSVPSARAPECLAGIEAVAMNDLQENVWSSVHRWHDWDEPIIFQVPTPVHVIHSLCFLYPCNYLLVCSATMKFSSRFGWGKTFWWYKWWSRDNLPAEVFISHFRKGICALDTKEDNHYLAS